MLPEGVLINILVNKITSTCRISDGLWGELPDFGLGIGMSGFGLFQVRSRDGISGRS